MNVTMSFHGLTPEDREYGRQALEHYVNKIDDDATAGELVRIAENFYCNSYPGLSIAQECSVIQKVSRQALAQLAAAEELGLADDIRDYGAVVARTKQQIEIMTFNKVHPILSSHKAVYNSLKDLE